MDNNKKYFKFIDNLRNYKDMMKPKYKHMFDVVAQLYTSRKIEKKITVEKLLNKLVSRGKAPQSAMKEIEKYHKVVASSGIKQKKEVIKPKENHTFHLTGSALIRVVWFRNDGYYEFNNDDADTLTQLYFKHGGPGFEIPKSIREKITPSIYYKSVEDADIVTANDRYDAVVEFKDNFVQSHEMIDQYRRVDVMMWEKIQDVNVKNNIKKFDMKSIKMKGARKVLKYEFLNHDDSIDESGYCVYNILKDRYNMSDEYVMSTAVEVEPVINKSDGLSSNQILHICQKNDISMYGFDQSKKCFIKHISKSRNSKALVYYLCNTHMYLVSDSDDIKSLVESSKSIEQKLNSVCLQDDKEKENVFDTLPIHEDLKIEEMLLLNESSIIIYNQSSLNDLHKKFMNMGLVCKLTKVRKTTIIKMQYTKVKATEKNSAIIFHMYADTNDYTQDLNHKVVKELCDLTKTKFSNQTFPSLIRELKTQFFNTKVERKRFTKDERQKMINETKVCQNVECKKELKLGQCEIDHITPLSAGGKDDISNLQLLCKSCHYDKTNEEQQNGEHVQHSQTYSSFNKHTESIFESPLSQCLAFIETVNEHNVKLSDEDIEKEITKRFEAYEKQALEAYIETVDEDMKEYVRSMDITFIGDDIKKQIKTEVEQQNDTQDTSHLYAMDINKCRRNELLFNEYDIPLFTVMDQPKPYKNHTCAGKYYVETDQYMPMHGNGWYDYPMIKYCLDLQLISKTDIKYVIESSLVTQNDHFNKFIEYIVDILPADKAKLAINSMIGGFAMNKDNEFWQCIRTTEHYREAFGAYIEREGCFINIQSFDHGEYYNVFEKHTSLNIETEKPIYDFVLQLEAIEMHKLSQIIEKNGGKILEYKTDCVVFHHPSDVFPFELIDEKNVKGFYFDDDEKVPKYKMEKFGGFMSCERKPRYIRTDKFELVKKSFRIEKDVDDNDFTQLVKLVLDDFQSCFISGPAGCGKSTLINQIKEELTSRKLEFNLLTPTNISAIIIGGTTLNKLQCRLRSKKILEAVIKDYVIVDEVSMMSEQFYKMLSVIQSFKPSTKFILVGDFNQFEPVKDRVGEQSKKYYSHSEVFHELTKSNILMLSKCRRSDDKHFNFCQNITKVRVSDYNNTSQDINICYTNKKRVEINNRIMNQKYIELMKHYNEVEMKAYDLREDVIRARRVKKPLPEGPPRPKILKLLKSEFSSKSQTVRLFKGVPVIAIKNKEKENFVNSEKFIVEDVDDNNIVIKNDEKTLTIPKNKFQLWFHVAYCITSHKSQGQTITVPYTIHDWNQMSETCKYVSLSRGTCWENVNLL